MQTQPSAQRKYALTRLAAGDYLLLGNDGTNLWRISRYEDGPSHGLEEWPRDRKLWGVWRSLVAVDDLHPEHVDDWGCWDMCAEGYETRRDAVDGAMHCDAS